MQYVVENQVKMTVTEDFTIQVFNSELKSILGNKGWRELTYAIRVSANIMGGTSIESGSVTIEFQSFFSDSASAQSFKTYVDEFEFANDSKMQSFFPNSISNIESVTAVGRSTLESGLAYSPSPPPQAPPPPLAPPPSPPLDLGLLGNVGAGVIGGSGILLAAGTALRGARELWKIRNEAFAAEAV